MPKRIGDVARSAGVGVETVRFYEREGLIDQPEKPLAGWRAYDNDAVAQLHLVRLAQQVGLSLSETKRLKNAARGSRQTFCSDVRKTVTARLAAVESEIADLQTKRLALRDWLGHCAQQESAPACALYNQVSGLISRPGKGKAI